MTPRGAATLTLLVLLVAGGYAASCAWWPFAHCRRCAGLGKHTRGDRKVWRTCRRCSGSGRRIRVGRRVWNRFGSIRKDTR